MKTLRNSTTNLQETADFFNRLASLTLPFTITNWRTSTVVFFLGHTYSLKKQSSYFSTTTYKKRGNWTVSVVHPTGQECLVWSLQSKTLKKMRITKPKVIWYSAWKIQGRVKFFKSSKTQRSKAPCSPQHSQLRIVSKILCRLVSFILTK